MKKFLLCTVVMFSALAVSAQEKVKELVTADYDRSGVSYVFVNRGGQHADVQKFYDTFTIDEKFDANKIPTKYLKMRTSTGLPTAAADVESAAKRAKLGKEVISFIFGRQEDGTCSDALLIERGKYNAKDQDIKNLNAAKVKEVWLASGEKLVNSSYIVIYDVYKTGQKRNDNGTITYSANAMAHVFKIKADQQVIDNFYAKAWVDASSSEADKQKAVAEFNKMKFDLELVASVAALGTSTKSKYVDGNIYKACLSAYDNAFFNLEKKIPAWQVKTTVTSVRPIAAKIGTKEGLKNADRYRAYSYKEDKNGKLVSVKHGYLRATVISNNKGVATGNTKPSYFYQISGAKNIKEGYTLKQDKDTKLGVALAFGLNANTDYALFRLGLDMDYIAHISQRGFITYGMVDVGLNFGTALLCDVMVGAGYGIPCSRFFEITPYAKLGGFYDTESESLSTYAFEPGARFALTFQPFSLFVSLGAQAAFGELTGVGFVGKLGLKWTF